MEGILRRSKSTREVREKYNIYEPSFSPALPPIPDARSYQHQQLPQNQQQQQKTLLRSTSLRKLTRRKSIASTQESISGLYDSWNSAGLMTTTTTITAEERKHRASIFFGLASPRNHFPVSHEAPKRAPPPPPIRLSTIPQRPSTAGALAEIDRNMEFGTGIGIALGRPTGTLGLEHSGAPSLPPLEKVSELTDFRLPSTPFNIAPDVLSHNPDPPISKPSSPISAEDHKPASGGWKIKLFSKGMFSRKNIVKSSQDPTPEIPELHHSIPKESNVLKKKKKKTKKPTKPSAPSLEVDIPSVELERYSIMFGSLLNPSENSPLYARRRSRDVNAGGCDTQYKTPQTLDLPKASLHRHATTSALSPRSPNPLLLPRSPKPPHPLPSPGLMRSQTTVGCGRPHHFPPALDDTHNTREFNTPTSPSPPPTHPSPTAFSPATPRGSFEDGDDEWLTRPDLEDEEADALEPLWEMLSPPSPGYHGEVAVARSVSVKRQEAKMGKVEEMGRLRIVECKGLGEGVQS